ncbi:MAG: FprA family A-type flavoprotein [Planctomycetota bacterium]|jgi:flavorubredoxin
MKPVEVLPGVKYVGAMHPDMRIFDDLFPTRSGTSYNSYLLEAESPVLIDTVKAKFADVLLENLRACLDPADLKYVVANHAEPDHSGSLARILDECPNATVVGSKPVGLFLKELLNRDFPFQAVKDGEELDLGGKRKLVFVQVPNLHWPDTIFTYLPDGEAAFTCDAFGAHYCPGEKLWAEDHPDYVDDQKTYYDCLVRLYGEFVRKAFAKVEGVPIKTVLPSHGPLLRGEELSRTLERYIDWSAAPVEYDKPLVGVVYLSAHGNTGKMARAVAEGAEGAGGIAELARWSEESDEQISALYERSNALAFGCPTINRDVPVPFWGTMALLAQSALPARKLAAYFGSYGWSGEAANLVEGRLCGKGYKLVAESVRARFAPTDADLEKCRALGAALVEAVRG